MAHGFIKQADRSGYVTFKKAHENGEETWVQVEQLQDQAEDWIVNVRDPRGNRKFGPLSTKSEAMDRAKRFMRENPKGVPGSQNPISGMGGGIPGTDGNGLF